MKKDDLSKLYNDPKGYKTAGTLRRVLTEQVRALDTYQPQKLEHGFNPVGPEVK